MSISTGYTSLDQKLAEELDIAVVVMSLIMDEVENPKNSRPMISDITCCRDADKIADVVMLLHRCVFFDPDKKELAEVIVANNQHGDGGIIEMSFMPEIMTFKEIIRKENDTETVRHEEREVLK